MWARCPARTASGMAASSRTVPPREGSSGGGVILGVARRLLRESPQFEHEEVVRGRAHMLRCRRADSEEDIAFMQRPLGAGSDG